MSVLSDEYVNHAKFMLTLDSKEITIRNAISRAYYSAYHAAEAYHLALPSPGSPRGDNFGRHELLIQQLINPTIRPEPEKTKSRAAGYILKELKIKRGDADYDLGASFTTDDAEQHIATVDELLARLIK